MQLEGSAGERARDRILIVDDNPVNLLFLERLLGKAGYSNVVKTMDAREAVRIVQDEDPDLAITDLHMPGMSGYEVVASIRGGESGEARIPILVFTADATGPARRQALEAGASDFLTKPGDPYEIALRVRNFLELRAMNRRLQQSNLWLEEKVRERTERLQQAQCEIVDRLARVGDYRDDATGDHSRRVGDLTYGIAIELGFTKVAATTLRLAAALHDIGKVAVPDAILKKEGALGSEETEVMRNHVLSGASILEDSSSELLQVAQTIARYHHERWDGTGYCEGLAGEEIPLEARIVAVADVFDALTSVRPYKVQWSDEAAIAEVTRLAGTHFDPRVVDAFLRANSLALAA